LEWRTKDGKLANNKSGADLPGEREAGAFVVRGDLPGEGEAAVLGNYALTYPGRGRPVFFYREFLRSRRNGSLAERCISIRS
jgi:hypothetical protein